MQVIWQNIHNCATSMDLCPEAFFDEKITEPLTVHKKTGGKKFRGIIIVCCP